MPKLKYDLRLLQVAEVDLKEITDYVAAYSLRAATVLLDKFEKSFLLLTKQPYLGRTPNDIDLIRQGYFCLTLENYLIFYVVQKQVVLIHRILHGARAYESILLGDRG